MTAAQPVTDAFYSVQEAAKLMKVHEVTIRRMIERGELRCRRFGRLIRIPAASLHGTDVAPLR